MGLIINLTPKEILDAKFKDTLVVIEGYLKEAEGDIPARQTYGAQGVYRRIRDIKDALEKDLRELEKDITVEDNGL
jgi:hypothetical protein